MKLVGLAVVGSLAMACTKPNPRSCADGTCTDPGLPFCDTDGALAGDPETCVAVDCSPGAFAVCRGDIAVTCNAAGSDYELIQCQRGCEPAAGCHLCDANETACTNGTLATCDSAGNIVSADACPLGCFENQPRCRKIAPSNGLGAYDDMVSNAPNIDLVGAVFRSADGSVVSGTQMISIPSFLVPAPTGGVAIRVFVVGSLKLEQAAFITGGPPNVTGPAIAIVSRGDVELRGDSTVDPLVGGALVGCIPPDPGSTEYDPATPKTVASGGGGGGNATTGGAGGSATGTTKSLGFSVGGGASGTDRIVPLRGGCSGGIGSTSVPNGGGALQISSETSIAVSGAIRLRGGHGGSHAFEGLTASFWVGGGGAGGSVLLEAPKVTLGAAAEVDARGGSGFQACTTPGPFCGVMGEGSNALLPGGYGGMVMCTGNVTDTCSGGGGGGGLGRIRINTFDGTYLKASSTIENGALTTGPVESR